jgi:hypothetical protein
MLGVDLETVRNVALAVIAGSVVLAIVLALVLKAIVSKVVTVAVLAVFAAVVWHQRSALEDCAQRVGQALAPGAQDATMCTFFGRDVTVDSPLG